MLIDIDKDIPACPARGIRMFMDCGDSPVFGPYYSPGVVPVDEEET
jgi:hypothetical protein